MQEQEREIDNREMRELAAIEAELASFRPGPGRLHRDRTMFLAGRASVGSETAPTASMPTTRRWATAFAAMAAVAGCLLVAVVVQQRSLIALRTEVPETNVALPAQPDRPLKQPAGDAPHVEEPSWRAFVDDFPRRGFERRRFGFSEERLLSLADSGTLTAGSFTMTGESRFATAAESTLPRDWPKQTYEPRSPPLPYYKLLKQLQSSGI